MLNTVVVQLVRLQSSPPTTETCAVVVLRNYSSSLTKCRMIQTAELQSTMPRSSCRYLESQVWIGWPLTRDKQSFISSGHINYLSVPAVLKYLLLLEKYFIIKVLLLFRTESNTILAVILLWAVILVVCVPVFLSHGLVLVIVNSRLVTITIASLSLLSYVVVTITPERPVSTDIIFASYHHPAVCFSLMLPKFAYS